MARKQIIVSRFKGLNTSKSASDIEDGEFSYLRNYYPENGRLVRRAGQRRLTTGSGYTEDLTGIVEAGGAVYVDSAARLVVGGLTTVAAYDNAGAFTAYTDAGGLLSSSATLWQFWVYKGIIYCARQGGGGATLNRLSAISGGNIVRAGIPAPGTSPTLTADAGGGTLAAGNYYGVVTFYNTATGMESNPSAASAVVTLAANNRIDWSGIPTSSSAQVDARRLYRTLAGQTGEYFFVAQVAGNVVTTYADDSVEPQALGRLVSFDNGTPPAGAYFGALWKERLFLSNGSLLYYSELGRPECFGTNSIIGLSSPSSGGSFTGSADSSLRVRAIVPVGERLLILCDRCVFYLQGTGPSTFVVRTLSDSIGCAATYSAAAGDGLAFWLGNNDFYMSDGASIKSIGRDKIRPQIVNIPRDASAQVDKAFGIVYERKHWYMCSVSQLDMNNGDTQRLVLVYNYQDDTWTTFDLNAGGSDVPSAFCVSFGTTEPGGTVRPEGRLYAVGTANHIYAYHEDDLGTGLQQPDDQTTGAGGTVVDITSAFRTKRFTSPDGPYKIGVRRVGLHMTDAFDNGVSSLGVGDFAIYHDYDAVQTSSAAVSRTGLSLTSTVSPATGGPRLWKVYNLSSLLNPGSTVTFELTNAISDIVVIQGLMLEIESFAPRFAIQPL